MLILTANSLRHSVGCFHLIVSFIETFGKITAHKHTPIVLMHFETDSLSESVDGE